MWYDGAKMSPTGKTETFLVTKSSFRGNQKCDGVKISLTGKETEINPCGNQNVTIEIKTYTEYRFFRRD